MQETGNSIYLTKSKDGFSIIAYELERSTQAKNLLKPPSVNFKKKQAIPLFLTLKLSLQPIHPLV